MDKDNSWVRNTRSGDPMIPTGDMEELLHPEIYENPYFSGADVPKAHEWDQEDYRECARAIGVRVIV